MTLSQLAFRSKASWGYSESFMRACRDELTVTEAQLRDGDRHCFIADSNGLAVGFYALVRSSADRYELDMLFVAPEIMRAGIGKVLVEHAKQHAKALGARCMVIQGDPNATAFYGAAGAVLVGERESASIPGRYLPEFAIDLG
ncbi:MAG: GNAT family N-acetyltransferase [Pseudomonadota bacterium]